MPWLDRGPYSVYYYVKKPRVRVFPISVDVFKETGPLSRTGTVLTYREGLSQKIRELPPMYPYIKPYTKLLADILYRCSTHMMLEQDLGWGGGAVGCGLLFTHSLAFKEHSFWVPITDMKPK
jgi:hypothetical protein